MANGSHDGSVSDADYGAIGRGYSKYRQPDPRILAEIVRHLDGARKVLNVGAGAGSYEPRDREVTAVEPSASMRAQRPKELPQAIDATAENLPFAEDSFDASMATFTVHQWSNLECGIGEMRRVTRGPVVIISCEPTALEKFWLHEYAPEVTKVEASRYPPIDKIAQFLGKVEIAKVPIPFDCRDGFNEAYYGRPERLLEPGARLACSGWSFVGPEVADRFVSHLQRDIADGSWDRRFGHFRALPEFDGPLRLIVGYP